MSKQKLSLQYTVHENMVYFNETLIQIVLLYSTKALAFNEKKLTYMTRRNET